MGMFREDYEVYDRLVTYDELKKEVEDEESYMSEEEKYLRLKYNDPTFLLYALSLISLHKNDTFIINEYTHKVEKVK